MSFVIPLVYVGLYDIKRNRQLNGVRKPIWVIYCCKLSCCLWTEVIFMMMMMIIMTMINAEDATGYVISIMPKTI